MEVSQFTYFQQVGGIECDPVSTELTYGLERLAMYVQGVESVYDLDFNGVAGAGRITYGDVFKRGRARILRLQFRARRHRHAVRAFRGCRGRNASALIGERRVGRCPAYDQCLKASHLSTCSMRAASSASPSAPPISAGCARSPSLLRDLARGAGSPEHAAPRSSLLPDRPCPDLFRASTAFLLPPDRFKTWMAGTSPATAGQGWSGLLTMRGELLLELLSEEIPARMQRRAIDDLTGLIRDKLAAAEIPAAELRGYVTPRRLTVIAEGIPERQPDRSEERRGPRVGAPQQALDGFLRAAGARVDRAMRGARHRPRRILFRDRPAAGPAGRRSACRNCCTPRSPSCPGRNRCATRPRRCAGCGR